MADLAGPPAAAWRPLHSSPSVSLPPRVTELAPEPRVTEPDPAPRVTEPDPEPRVTELAPEPRVTEPDPAPLLAALLPRVLTCDVRTA